MMSLPQADLALAQRDRLARFECTRCVDIHCHCLPGLDDGPRTMAEAIDLCRALVDDGITTAIATPHQLGRFDAQHDGDSIRQAVQSLREALEAADVPLDVVPGADVRVDERILSFLDSGRILTLGDAGRYLLLELPHGAFIEIAPLIGRLVSRGLTPIISHPERNAFLPKRPEVVPSWLGQGALLQVTAASLLGDFGRAPEEAAWGWLGTGAASLVATDSHDTASRRPKLSAAIDAIAERLGNVAAYRTCIDSPARVLDGEPITASPHQTRHRGTR
jgi:protein-tyrosine phosphatase